jgi:hypothetical protein
MGLSDVVFGRALASDEEGEKLRLIPTVGQPAAGDNR